MESEEKGPSLYDAVVAQGTFLEKYMRAIQMLPEIARAVQAQAGGLVNAMQRIARIEQALRLPNLPQGAQQQLRVVKPVEVKRFEKPVADYDYDEEDVDEMEA